MTAFANPKATEVFDLGEELCPPRPDGSAHHTTDTVTLRSEFSHGDVVQLSRALLPSMNTVDPFGQKLLLLSIGAVAWTFVDETGKPVPVDAEHLELLRPDIADRLTERLDENYQRGRGSVPNESGAPSPASTPETSSAPRTKRTPRSKKH